MSIIVSVFFYFVFALIYNGMCVNCLGPDNPVPYWVIQRSMGTVQFWAICLLAAVMAVLPRYNFHFCSTSTLYWRHDIPFVR